MHVAPVTLEGRLVRLEPLQESHFQALCAIGLDERIWRWNPMVVRGPADLRRWLDDAIAQRDAGKAVPFATLDRATGRLVGSTRFMNIDRTHRRCEIGATWLHPDAQRTGFNTEAKLLMFTHAFETWRCVRVELKTDALNEQSRAAMARLGLVCEGCFRQHVVCESGRLRDSVWFSAIDREWPELKARIQGLLR